MQRFGMWVGFRPGFAAGLLALVALLATGGAAAQAEDEEPETIPAEKAGEHIGEEVRVCGVVADTTHLQTMDGQPTFLNFGAPFPDRVFGVVIYEESAEKFRRRPDRLYRDRFVCVTGTVELAGGSPRMTVTEPEAIEIIEPDTDGCGSGIS